MSRKRNLLSLVSASALMLAVTAVPALQAHADDDTNDRGGCPLFQTVPFVTGADVSELAREEQLGTVYKDMNGNPIDAMQEFQNEHWNCVRLRLWVNPSGQDIFVNDLNYTIALAKRAKAHGMRWILDLHYSDTWADPGHQTPPAAWANMNYHELRNTVRLYTAYVLWMCELNGVPPTYVQVGNEVDAGLLWPTGYINNYDQFVGLLKAGVEGVRMASDAKVIIHISNGQNTDWVEWFFDKLNATKLDYDVMGLSYYPPNGTDLSDIKYTLNAINGRYNKKIMIMEFSYHYGWGVSSGYGYWNTWTGQQQIVWDLCQSVRGISNGAGVMYWGATYLWNPNLQYNWGGQTLFNWDGTSLPAQGSLWAQ